MRKCSFFIILFLCVSINALAQNASFIPNYDIQYLTDRGNSIDLTKAQNLFTQNKFKKVQGDLNLGFGTNAAWLHIDLRETDAGQRILMLKEPHFENVDIYYFSDTNLIKSIHTGKNLDFHSREIEHIYFNSFIPFKATTVFIKVHSKASMIIPIEILTFNDYLTYVSGQQMFHWMFFGFILLILITNIVIFIWQRELLYFYYILFIVSLGLIVAVLKGYAFQFLWPDYPFMNEGNRFVYLLIIFAVLFTEKLLDLKNKMPFQHKVFKVFYASFAILLVIGVLFSRKLFLLIYFPTVMFVITYCLFLSINYYRKFKSEASTFLLSGWFFFCTCFISYLIYAYGFLPHHFIISNLVQIGVSLQIIFFNVAILSQINTLKKEKEQLLVDQNRMLEERVGKRTMELQAMNEEFQALNEELQAMNEELQAMNEESTSQNDMLVQQQDKLAEQKKVIEEKNELLENHQKFLESQVEERTKEFYAVHKELTISEERYRSLVEHSPEAIIVLDVELGTFVDGNKKACELFKLSKQELLLRNPMDLSAEFQADGLPSKGREDFLKKAIEGKNPVFEWMHRDSQGKEIPTEIYLTRLPSKDRILIRGSIIDITERKKQLEAVRIREERLKTVVNNVPIVLWASDKNGSTTLLDGKAKESLSSNPDQLLNENILELFKSDEVSQDHLIDLFNSKKDFDLQIKKSGRTFDLKATRMDEGGNFVGYIGLLIDITERIESEKRIKSFIDYQSKLIDQIKHQEAGLSSLINSTSDWIYSLDRDLNLIEFNQAFKEGVLRRINVHLWKGMNYRMFISEGALKTGYEENMRRVLSGETMNVIHELKLPDGNSRFFSITNSPIFSDRNFVSGVTTIARDITDTKLAEFKMLEMNKEMAEYKLMALRSVMNPHFLFNSLNSIQYYIASQDRKLALDYLSIFSMLIRKVLYSSLNPLISLDEELEILKYYISLEKLRFENKFESEIIIDEDLISEEMEIPSLLIQPYVENAILHGLMNKVGQGKLKIHVTMEQDDLVVTVEDNGIGREQARIIKEKNRLTEKSYGMLVTKERLEIINKRNDVSVIIEDLVDRQQGPLGTKVKIFIKAGQK